MSTAVIGVPSETIAHERRVALVPAAAASVPLLLTASNDGGVAAWDLAACAGGGGGRAARAGPPREAGRADALHAGAGLFSMHAAVHGGDDVRVATLPEPVAVQRPPLAFQQQCTLRDGVLTIRRQMRVGAAELPAAAFPDWLRALAAADRAEKATIELTTRQ
jgi:hypothetical protein